MVRNLKFLFLLFLFSAVGNFAIGNEGVVLAGPPTAVARALDNLLGELNSPEPRFQPDDIKVQLEVWDVADLLETDNQDPALVLGRNELSRLHAQLEATLRRPLPLRNRKLSVAEADAFKEQVGDTAEILWPLYEKLGIREVPVAPSFMNMKELLWQSVSNPVNLRKAAARFIILGTLTATAFGKFEGLSFTQSAILGTVAGGLSFFLMASNDLYSAYIDGPFFTKIPTPQYMESLETDPARASVGGKLKQAAITSVKDLIVYAGYLSIFTYVSIKMGAAPDTWSEIISNFFKGCALGVAAETALKAATARATTRAVSHTEKALGADSAREVRRIRNLAATVAFFQSITYTPFELAMSIGNVFSEVVMWGLSGFGLTSYLVVISSPDSKVGKFRDERLFPILYRFSNAVVETFQSSVAMTCQTVLGRLRR